MDTRYWINSKDGGKGININLDESIVPWILFYVLGNMGGTEIIGSQEVLDVDIHLGVLGIF